MTASETLRDAAIMLAAGVGVPVLAALNAQLGSRIASPSAAAAVLFAVALLAALAVMLVTSGPAPLARLTAQPAYLLLGGLLIAAYLLSVTWIAPRFGLGNAIFCVLLGQLASAALIDHFGLMGAPLREISLWRAGGLAVMAMGLVMVLKA